MTARPIPWIVPHLGWVAMHAHHGGQEVRTVLIDGVTLEERRCCGTRHYRVMEGDA